MRPFCRIEEFEDLGQVLVEVDPADESGPSLSTKLDLTGVVDGVSICSSSVSFEDTERGVEHAYNKLNELSRDNIHQMGVLLKDKVSEIAGGEG